MINPSLSMAKTTELYNGIQAFAQSPSADTSALKKTTTNQHYYSKLIPNQQFAHISSLTLETGESLEDFHIAYKTWGKLNSARDNVLVVCHALTGSSDVGDWWSPLMGPGKALDYTRFFIFCANCLGSPYGSHSPLSLSPKSGRPYGQSFPATSIRDDVNAHKLVLDSLGITSVAAVIGGSMGGMATLEWPLCTPKGYVKTIIPIATSISHSAWGIAWAETQRQCIRNDPAFRNGDYEPIPEYQPAAGLSAARMIAMLTYRSSMSFEARFGREFNQTRPKNVKTIQPKPKIDSSVASLNSIVNSVAGSVASSNTSPHFSAQSYLHYQGTKFINRFDANCYLHILDKMDKHDIARGRSVTSDGLALENPSKAILSNVPAGALVVGIESDVLFPPSEQERLAQLLPDATLAILSSQNGHDGFLIDLDELNQMMIENLHKQVPQIYEGEPFHVIETNGNDKATGESMVGEREE